MDFPQSDSPWTISSWWGPKPSSCLHHQTASSTALVSLSSTSLSCGISGSSLISNSSKHSTQPGNYSYTIWSASVPNSVMSSDCQSTEVKYKCVCLWSDIPKVPVGSSTTVHQKRLESWNIWRSSQRVAVIRTMAASGHFTQHSLHIVPCMIRVFNVSPFACCMEIVSRKEVSAMFILTVLACVAH